MQQHNFDNYFTIFELNQEFKVDLALIEQRYLKLQQEFHPDNFSDSQQRLEAVVHSSFINDAYNSLTNDLKRAQYLLSLLGNEIDSERVKINDPAFLMEQLELRSKVANLAINFDQSLFDEIQQYATNQYQLNIASLEKSFAENDLNQVVNLIDRLKYNCKLLDELDSIMDQLLS